MLLLFNRYFLFFIISAIFGGSAFGGGNAALKIKIKGHNSVLGSIVIGVASSRTQFEENMSPDSVMQYAVKPDGYYEIQVPPGKYAVMVYHDENGNGKLDINSNGVPSEKRGFSKNISLPNSSKPNFDDILINVEKDKENIHHIELR